MAMSEAQVLDCSDRTGGADVVIVEDHLVSGQGLAFALRQEGTSTAIVTGTELTGLLAAGSLRAQVVVLDLELDNDIDGTDLVAPVRATGATVLICSAETARHRLGACVERG